MLLHVADWVEELVFAAQHATNRHGRVLELSRDARAAAHDDESLRSQVAARLRERPDLVHAWQMYSWDKRWSPSPYLEAQEVGLYDSGYRDVEQHPDLVTACAAFIAREVDWLRTRHQDEP